MKPRLRREIDSKLAMLGRNHRWLAGELGICRQYLSQILNGKKHSIRVVKRLAAWADVTIDEVLEMTGGGDGKNQAQNQKIENRGSGKSRNADRVDAEVGG